MKAETRRALVVVGAAVGVAALVLIPGTGVVATIGAGVAKVIDMVRARGRRPFLEQVGREVSRQLEELRPDLSPEARTRAAAIVAAQGALETNDGRTPAWTGGWNFGNVTAGSSASWSGPVVEAGDTEPDANGVYQPIKARFRKYGSLAEAVSDYLVHVLAWKRERDAGVMAALVSGDADAYAERLHAAGYYTAPVADYQAGIAKRLDVALEVLA